MINKMIMNIFLFMSIAPAFAGHNTGSASYDCGLGDIDSIRIYGASRDTYSNMLVVKLIRTEGSGTCAANSIVSAYIDNTDLSYETIVSLLSMAQTIGLRVRLVVEAGMTGTTGGGRILELGFY